MAFNLVAGFFGVGGGDMEGDKISFVVLIFTTSLYAYLLLFFLFLFDLCVAIFRSFDQGDLGVIKCGFL